MTIRILESAKRDITNGFHFYERQDPGLGDYFLDSIYSDINSLLIYHGIHSVKFEVIIHLTPLHKPLRFFFRLFNAFPDHLFTFIRDFLFSDTSNPSSLTRFMKKSNFLSGIFSVSSFIVYVFTGLFIL